jgi:hypothetical protein
MAGRIWRAGYGHIFTSGLSHLCGMLFDEITLYTYIYGIGQGPAKVSDVTSELPQRNL